MSKITEFLFGTKSPKPQATLKPSVPAPLTYSSQDVEIYFRDEVNKSKYLKDDARNTVIQHLLGRINILKTSNKLSVAEKRSLGINTRLTITKELISVLNDDGIRLSYPSAVITEMWSRATIKKSRHDQLKKLRSIPIKKFNLVSCGNENDCTWCKKNQNVEFDSNFDVEKAIEEHCQCDPYCACLVSGVHEF